MHEAVIFCKLYVHSLVHAIPRLVVFGGRGADRKRLNDVHFLDVKTWTWHRPTTDGMPPIPRLGAAAVFMGGQMILFGGYGAGARLNDLHTLDLTSWQWQQPAFTGTAPSPRQSPGIALQGQHRSTVQLECITLCKAWCNSQEWPCQRPSNCLTCYL